jgi:hypothetical protein
VASLLAPSQTSHFPFFLSVSFASNHSPPFPHKNIHLEKVSIHFAFFRPSPHIWRSFPLSANYIERTNEWKWMDPKCGDEIYMEGIWMEWGEWTVIGAKISEQKPKCENRELLSSFGGFEYIIDIEKDHEMKWRRMAIRYWND